MAGSHARSGGSGPLLRDGVDSLSPRQREVLELVSKGLTNDEIGQALRIAATTVHTHISAILSRLDVTNRAEAAAAFAARPASVSRIAEVLRRPAIVVLRCARASSPASIRW